MKMKKKVKNMSITIYNAYCTNNKIKTNFWYDHLFSNSNGQVILRGDWHAKNKLWHCKNNDSRGNDIVKHYAHSLLFY